MKDKLEKTDVAPSPGEQGVYQMKDKLEKTDLASSASSITGGLPNER